MSERESRSNKGPFEGVVSANRQIGKRFYRLSVYFEGGGGAAFAGARPGQFAELDLSGAGVPAAGDVPAELADVSRREVLLRRPFSFCDVEVRGDKTFVEILYCVVGPASLRMTSLSGGEKISVIGPLGRGFWVPEGKKVALLVAGGMGSPPLEHLAKVLTAEHSDIDVVVFAGARTAEELPFAGRLDEVSQNLGFSLREFAKYGVESLVATDDGSLGFAGYVTDCMEEWLGGCDAGVDEMIIYGCGPEEMLSKLARIADERGIECQVSMERRMACGIGVCQSCVVECKVGSEGERIYKLCCKDGPVFESREVVFGE